MLKTVLGFMLLAGLCLLVADIDITHVDPALELGRMARGALAPDFSVLWRYKQAFLMTVVFAFCGVALGVLGGVPAALCFHYRPVRLVCAALRAVHELFWAFLFLPVFGLSPLCGVLAIAVPYAGIFAKVYAEILAESDTSALNGFPPGTDAITRLLYGVLPLIFPAVRSYTRYRFECGLRSSAVLGFIGLPTLGYHLETFFREGSYHEAAAVLLAFYLLVAGLRFWLHPRLVPFLVVLSFILLPKGSTFALGNLVRVVTRDIVPWPMRRAGFLDGSGDLAFPVRELWDWVVHLFGEQVLPGSYQTLVLTQIVLVGAGLVALPLAFAGTRTLHGPPLRWPARIAGIVLRTTPEYILAYLFLQVCGPSMLPAVLALSLHNGAILGHLSMRRADDVVLPADAPRRTLDRFFYCIFPRIDGHFLAFLFYRWEVMMRESAILGILGVAGLGFFIDSAMAEDRLDRAVLLIAAAAVLNMGIDALSTYLRRRLDITTALSVQVPDAPR